MMNLSMRAYWFFALSIVIESSMCHSSSNSSVINESTRHHLVGVDIPSDMDIPKGYLLDSDKKLQCLTCHGEKIVEQWRIELKEERILSYAIVKNRKKYKSKHTSRINFLRNGPYQKVSDFCYGCHKEKNSKPSHFHISLDQNRNIIESQCLYCHKKVPDEDKLSKINVNDFSYKHEADTGLRLPKEKICIGCHLKTPHLNAEVHQVKINEIMKQRIERYSLENNRVFPLGDDSKIICITCHSPHQKGVLSKQNPAAKQAGTGDLSKGIMYEKSDWANTVLRDKKSRFKAIDVLVEKIPNLRYMKIEHEELIRLPAKDGSLCLLCHTFDH